MVVGHHGDGGILADRATVNACPSDRIRRWQHVSARKSLHHRRLCAAQAFRARAAWGRYPLFARTTADLGQAERIEVAHTADAIEYRPRRVI